MSISVLFVSSWFPSRAAPLNGDFVERHALAVSRLCNTSVVYVTLEGTMNHRFMETLEIHKNGLYEVFIYMRRNRSSVKRVAQLINLIYYAIGYLKGYRMVRRKRGKPDVIHGNIIFPVGAIVWLCHVFTGIPYIISEHWTIYLSGNKKAIPSGCIYRKAVKKAYALVPVSQNLRQALIRLGYVTNYFVVPNVVDPDLFKRRRDILPGEKKRLLHVSSMKEEHKNITGIISAIRHLRDRRDDFTLTLVGTKQVPQVEMAGGLILSEDIVFTGELSHAEVAEIMQQSHILVMFSRLENLPCVILEAMSCGLPVVSSDVGGIGEWITPENGVLVKSEDETSLVNALDYVLDRYTSFDPEHIRRYATEHFSPDKIAGQFLEIYRCAMNKHQHV